LTAKGVAHEISKGTFEPLPVAPTRGAEQWARVMEYDPDELTLHERWRAEHSLQNSRQSATGAPPQAQVA
jgi:hypothetical protein